MGLTSKKYLGILFSILIVLVLTSKIKAQEIDVTGQVTAASGGNPLPGVNIMIKGTSTGTTSNAEGNYEIATTSNDTLVFSFIGFQAQEVPVGNQEIINVQLVEGTETLDEVIVTGYGTVSKRRMSSSISQVDDEELGDVTVSQPVSMLQGKISGVEITNSSGKPGESPDIRIRGAGSISAGTQPLFVIDGVIAGTGSQDALDAVSPEDIQSMTVLKDAAATALYGSRASNGVVVVTTKSGSSGGDTQINLSTTTGFNQMLRGNLEMMSTQELYNFHESMNSPLIEPDLLNTQTDWIDIFYRNAMTSKYNASVSGGNERTSFYVSGNYYAEEGTHIDTGFDRISGRIKLDHTVSENFEVSGNVSVNRSDYDNVVAGSRYNSLTFSYRLLPWDQPYQEDGTPTTGEESSWMSRDGENPLYPMQWNYDEGYSTYFSGNLRLQYYLTDWADFTSTNRYSSDRSFSEMYYDRRTQIGSSNNGQLIHNNTLNTSIITSNLLNLSQDWQPHSLSGILGFEYQENRFETSGFTGIGVPIGLTVMDAAADVLTGSGAIGENAFLSVLAQAEYEYDNTYIATLSFRRDGSSRFGSNNRFGNFYSIGGSWNISNESFMEDYEAIEQLALRASYGTTGNAEIGNYDNLGLYTYAIQYGGTPASEPIQVANPNLTWEVAHTYNAGIDLDLYNRINMSLDFYQRRNEDLLQSVRLPGTSGIDSRLLNVGAVQNRGIEFSVTTTNIENEEFVWNTNFNISRNSNKVLDLYGGEPIPNGNQRIMEGEDLNTWYMRKWAGVDPENGDPLWERLITNSEGEVTDVELTNDYASATLQNVGSSTPDFTGGLRNTLQYKGVTFSTFFQFVYGGKLLHSMRGGIDSHGAYPTMRQMRLPDGWSRWEGPGDEDATHPRPVYGGNNSAQRMSSFYLEDRSYLRLKNAKVSYSVPQSLGFMQNANLRSLQVFASGDNLLTFTEFSGRDPEASFYGNRGYDYPSARSVLFGIELGL